MDLEEFLMFIVWVSLWIVLPLYAAYRYGNG